MTKSVLTPPFTPNYSSGEFLWTVERYHHAIDNGTFAEDDKVELIHGQIFELVPTGSPHAYSLTLLTKFFRRQFGELYQLREEKTVSFKHLQSEPEPDLAVAVDKNYSKHHPGKEDILLVIEVANTSLDKDRSRKAELYAQAGLPEYWIVNLIDRQIEVHLQPQPGQGRYGSLITYAEQDTFTSPFAGEVIVAELLPDPEAEEDNVE